MAPVLIRYELWQEPDGYSFFSAENESARHLLSAEAALAWYCVASSWEEAEAMKAAYLGWDRSKSQ